MYKRQDHATPAAFYAHQGQRSSYYNVGLDLIDANFDFYAGSDFLDPTQDVYKRQELCQPRIQAVRKPLR